MNNILLDSEKGIVLDLENRPISNLQSLLYLPEGLQTLAVTVRQEEIKLIQVNNGKPPVLMICGFQGDGLIACCFNWFATSLVNYLRLIALIDLMQVRSWSSGDVQLHSNHKDVKDYCRAYVREVVPEVYQWRNKIAAHFAMTDPFKDDSLGTLELSVMNPVSYGKPYFRTGAFHWVANNEKSEIQEWALTEIYEKLSPRLWPDRPIPSLPVTVG